MGWNQQPVNLDINVWWLGSCSDACRSWCGQPQQHVPWAASSVTFGADHVGIRGGNEPTKYGQNVENTWKIHGTYMENTWSYPSLSCFFQPWHATHNLHEIPSQDDPQLTGTLIKIWKSCSPCHQEIRPEFFDASVGQFLPQIWRMIQDEDWLWLVINVETQNKYDHALDWCVKMFEHIKDNMFKPFVEVWFPIAFS